MFLENSRGFTLSFDDLMAESYYDAYLWLEIKGETGANIRQISYINIDRWDQTLLDKLGDLFGYGGYGGYGGSAPVPQMPSW